MQLIQANWNAPQHIHAFTTSRIGGVSQAPYDQFNLAKHVDEANDITQQNRDILIDHAQLPESPRWLTQTHSTIAVDSEQWVNDIEADAIFSDKPKHVCCVMTADCLPVLITNESGTWVAAIHAGWRGLANGIIANTVKHYAEKENLLAWLGPAIGPIHFEVGVDVYDIFTKQNSHNLSAFQQTDEQHYLADIYQLARIQLNALNINNISGGEHCTFAEADTFYSYRREKQTGRMASIIWIDHK